MREMCEINHMHEMRKREETENGYEKGAAVRHKMYEIRKRNEEKRPDTKEKRE